MQTPASLSKQLIALSLSLSISLSLALWQPLPETEYNGNPESVGYRVRVWRADQPGDTSTKVVNDRLEREITLESLEEWTEYLFQIQAFNFIGPGPWSEPMKGRTRESGNETQSQNLNTHTQWSLASHLPNKTDRFMFSFRHILSRDGFLNEYSFTEGASGMFILLLIAPLDTNTCRFNFVLSMLSSPWSRHNRLFFF